jgi:hypothetical protein
MLKQRLQKGMLSMVVRVEMTPGNDLVTGLVVTAKMQDHADKYLTLPLQAAAVSDERRGRHHEPNRPALSVEASAVFEELMHDRDVSALGSGLERVPVGLGQAKPIVPIH